MKQFLLLTILMFYSISSWSQAELSVKSFKILADDKDAKINFPIKDQNGDNCAIIKVITNETDFFFDGGLSGIVKNEKSGDGYWLYVPLGSKRITIKHDKLGVLRDYIYTESIEEGSVYELVLTGERIKTIVVDEKEDEASVVWLIVKSNPVGADFYINDVKKGVTPLSFKTTSGKYTYYLEKPKYNSLTGDFSLTGNEPDGKKELVLNMKPALGLLKINSLPEANATVVVDGVEMSTKTPISIESMKIGKYSILVKKNMYLPVSEEIIFNDNDTIEKTITLKPNFGNITVSAQPEAAIFIDSVLVGQGIYKNRISPGVHTFEANKENVKYKKEIKTIQHGDNITINMVIITDQGNIDITTEPPKANIIIDDKNYGKTPRILEKLSIGRYNIKLEKEGYETMNMAVVVQESATTPVKVTLKALINSSIPADTTKLVQKTSAAPKDSVKTIDKIQKQVGVTLKQFGVAIKKVEGKVKKVITKDK